MRVHGSPPDGQPRRTPCVPWKQGWCILAERRAERERLVVVVCEQLRLVVALAGELFDPLGGGLVLLRAVGAADLGVGDVLW